MPIMQHSLLSHNNAYLNHAIIYGVNVLPDTGSHPEGVGYDLCFGGSGTVSEGIMCCTHFHSLGSFTISTSVNCSSGIILGL